MCNVQMGGAGAECSMEQLVGDSITAEETGGAGLSRSDASYVIAAGARVCMLESRGRWEGEGDEGTFSGHEKAEREDVDEQLCTLEVSGM